MTVSILSKVKMVSERVENNSHDMQNMDAWKVTLFFRGKQYTTNYYMGYGHNGKEPEKELVIDSLLLDSSCADYLLETFMEEFGYKDIAKARRILEACERVDRNIRRLFTDVEIEILQDELEEAGYR